MSTTKEPITTSGWYEHTDGTVGYYAWRQTKGGNNPHLLGAVPNWSATTPSKEAITKLRDAAIAAKDNTEADICSAALDGAKDQIRECALLIASKGQ